MYILRDEMNNLYDLTFCELATCRFKLCNIKTCPGILWRYVFKYNGYIYNIRCNNLRVKYDRLFVGTVLYTDMLCMHQAIPLNN